MATLGPSGYYAVPGLQQRNMSVSAACHAWNGVEALWGTRFKHDGLWAAE